MTPRLTQAELRRTLRRQTPWRTRVLLHAVRVTFGVYRRTLPLSGLVVVAWSVVAHRLGLSWRAAADPGKRDARALAVIRAITSSHRRITPMLKTLVLAAALALTLAPPAAAVSCVTADVTASGFACDAGGLHFSHFAVSPSAVLTNASIGIGSVTAPAGLTFQISTTPGVGPGDILLSYTVEGGLTGVGLANGGIAPVTVGEIVCTKPGLTCPTTNRIAELIVNAGETKSAGFAAVDFASIVKDIELGTLGFISVLENFHTPGGQPPAPVPEPATMLLLGSALAGVGVVARRRRRS